MKILISILVIVLFAFALFSIGYGIIGLLSASDGGMDDARGNPLPRINSESRDWIYQPQWEVVHMNGMDCLMVYGFDRLGVTCDWANRHETE